MSQLESQATFLHFFVLFSPSVNQMILTSFGSFCEIFFFLTTSISSMVIGLFRFLFEPVFLVETLSMNLCISSQLSYLGYKIIISFYHLLQCLRALQCYQLWFISFFSGFGVSIIKDLTVMLGVFQKTNNWWVSLLLSVAYLFLSLFISLFILTLLSTLLQSYGLVYYFSRF